MSAPKALFSLWILPENSGFLATPLLLGAAIASGYQLLRVTRRFVRWSTSPLWKLPGPRNRSFFFGSFWEILQRPFMEPHKEWWESAGKETTDLLHYTGWLGSSAVVILNADYAKQILGANNRTDNPPYIKIAPGLERLLGNGLVTLEGLDWHRHRRIIHPSFQVSFLRSNLDRTVPSRVDSVLQAWKKAGQHRSIDLSSHFSMLTLDILGEVAFAHDFRGMEAIREWAVKEAKPCNENKPLDELPQVSDGLIRAMNNSMRASPSRILMGVLGMSFLDREATRTYDELNTAVQQVVTDARTRCNQKDRNQNDLPPTKYAPKSVLEALLDAKDAEGQPGNKSRKTLSNEELVAEVKTFLVAGHETTSTWCYWAVYCLCKYPEVQEKLYQEILEHSTDSRDSNIDLETVEQMPYLDAFLNEVLRLYSPVGMMVRYNNRQELFGKAKIPPRTRLVIPMHLLHRSPRYWRDPEDFRPERWMSQDKPYSHPYAFLPFSHGPRNCIGYRFATMEAKLILAPMIRSVRFELTPELREAKFDLTSFVTVKAKPAVKVHAKFRA